MRIAILTMGTRGDIQPYAVLGKALRERGHEVNLATAKNFKELVLSYGIGFVPVEADMQAILEGEEGKKMMKGNPFAIRRNLNTWVYPLVTRSLLEFYQLARESDLVLYHVKTLADTFADQFPHKMVRTSVLPIIEATSAFPNPAFSGLPVPGFLNRFSYSLSQFSIRLLSKPVGEFRQQAGLPGKYKQPPVWNIYGLSPAFLPVPSEYPVHSQYNGFWFQQPDKQLAEDLERFLQDGDPPLLITFGSMPFRVRFDMQAAILRICRELKIRIIVVKGWGFEDTEKLEEQTRIKVISSAPYEVLFPKVKAVVHHGGIGTTSECVRAGKPFFICPVMYPIGDQWFWGLHSWKKGIAVYPVPLKKLTEEKFIKGVTDLISHQALYREAENLAKAVQEEEGLRITCERLEQYYQQTLNSK